MIETFVVNVKYAKAFSCTIALNKVFIILNSIFFQFKCSNKNVYGKKLMKVGKHFIAMDEAYNNHHMFIAIQV